MASEGHHDPLTGEIVHLDLILATAEAPREVKLNALLERACAYLHRDQWAQARADCAVLLAEVKDHQHRQIASLVDATAALGSGEATTATAGFDQLLAESGLEPSLRPIAAFNRSTAQLIRGDIEGGITGYRELFEDQDTPSEIRIDARLMLAQCYRETGALERSAEVLWQVANDEASNADSIMMAMINRGVLMRRLRGIPREIRHYEFVIRSPQASPSRLAAALINRGNALWTMGDESGAIADFSQATAAHEPDLRAMSLRSRGIVHLRAGRQAEAILDFRSALAVKGLGPILATELQPVVEALNHKPESRTDQDHVTIGRLQPLTIQFDAPTIMTISLNR